ncbi:MAG: hypothetical protein K9G76_12805 [Bacteroidales bacterium]|nr:hypothetical protein [Bacteroidales bacterium]MCF8405651.1 hypothetical protein [Bacteroidales bacterium]
MKKLKLTTWKKTITILLLLIVTNGLLAEQVDVRLNSSGIFPGAYGIFLKPDYNFTNAFTTIQFALKINDPALLSFVGSINGFGFAANGPSVQDPVSGDYYQFILATPTNPPVTWTAGVEYEVGQIVINPSVQCGRMEIVEDNFALSLNMAFYIALNGFDKTGVIYEPLINLGSEGGYVAGGFDINFGQSTGTLVLTDYNGNVLGWKKRVNNGAWFDISGTAGQTIYSETPVAPGVWEYTAEVQLGSCPSILSVPAKITVVGETHWIGGLGNDWSTDGNWDNGIPTEYLKAIIPDVSPNPFPYLNKDDGMSYGIEIASGASLTIEPLGALTTLGDFSNEGEMTIQSSADGDGSFIDNGIVTGSGLCHVERYLVSERWHYVSPPISNAQSMVFYNIYLKEFNEPDSTWTYIEPTNVGLDPLKGYACWADDDFTGTTTVTYTGSLNYGTYSSLMTNTLTATHGSKGYNFIGNPFPSALNWDATDGWDNTNTDATFYSWNPTEGQYGSYTEGDGGSGINGITNVIPSGQGFFLHVTDGVATGSVEVNTLSRVHHDKPFLKGSKAIETSRPYLRLNTYSGVNQYEDEIVVQFDDEATVNHDGRFDAFKWYGLDEAPQMYTLTADNRKLALNTWENPVEDVTINMGYRVGEAGIYTIEVSNLLNFEPGIKIILEDLLENELTDLTSISSYSFYAEPEDSESRFKLHFNPDSISSTQEISMANVLIYGRKNHICFRYSDSEPLDGILNVFNLTGQLINSVRVSSETEYNLFISKPGIYIATYISGHDKKIYRNKVSVR